MAFLTTLPARRPRTRRLIGALLATLIAGCAFTEGSLTGKGSRPLTGAEVQALLTKARYRWEAAGGASGTATTTPDGRIRMMWESGAVNGRVRFTANGYCSRFESVRGGAEDCYRLHRTGPQEYTVFREDGTHSGKITLLN